MFFPLVTIAKEKGLLYSTLQQEDETCPNFSAGNLKFLSLTKCEPSGIDVFLSTGTIPTIFCLSGFIKSFFESDLFPMKSFFF